MHIIATAIMALIAVAANAQEAQAVSKKALFERFDIGLSASNAGLSADVATPLAKWVDVRAGVSYMPRFTIPMTFGLETFDTDGTLTSKFGRMQELMRDYFSITIDDQVNMDAKCTMIDFKLLFDFYPLPDNRHWHLTAGFYWGAAKVGHIQNAIRDMNTTVGVNIYNGMYDFFVDEKYIDVELGNGIYLNPEFGDELRDKFLSFGRVGVQLGTFKDTGKPYIMEPDKDSMLQADMFVNHFKPYLGAGYSTALSKDKKWNFGCELGALFWGGTPSIITHPNLNYEGNTVNLSTEVEGIRGKVGDYVSFAKTFKVYPTLNIRFSYTIF